MQARERNFRSEIIFFLKFAAVACRILFIYTNTATATTCNIGFSLNVLEKIYSTTAHLVVYYTRIHTKSKAIF